MTDFSEEEKATMLDHIIDELINTYDLKVIEKGFHSKAEVRGYRTLTILNDNGFVTSEGILGK